MGPLFWARVWALMRLALGWVGRVGRVGMVSLVGCQLAQAEVYRWVDDQGRVHFEDRKPVKELPNGLEEVKVRRGNTVQAVQMRPVEPVPTPELHSPPIVLTLPGMPQKNATGVAASQAACSAKMAAFESARACFDACATTNAGWYGSSRNISKCGHCTDVPMPRC